MSYGFDGLYGQDAYAYYRYAMGALRQNLLALEAPAPFYWPPGYPLLVALFSLLLGTRPIAAQIVSLAAGALVPVFTALLAYELWAHVPDSLAANSKEQSQALSVAFVAGLVSALTPQLWQSSAVIMPDTTALALATLGAWALLRYGHSRRGAWLALSAAALAFAILTRLPYVLVAFAGAAYALLLLGREQRHGVNRGVVALAQGAVSLVITLAILSPLLVSLLQRQPDNGGQTYLANLGTIAWRLGHALQNEFVTGNGIQRYRLANGLYYALAPAHRFFFTPLLAPFLLPGLWRLWKRRTPSRILLLVVWPLAGYLLLVGYPVQNFRFTLTFLPPLAIILATGLFVSAQWLGRARPLLIVLPAAALLWMAYGGWTLTESFILRKQANLATVSWVQQQVEPQAQLFTFGITLTFEQYADLHVHDLYALSAPQMNDLLQGERPAYLLVDVENIENQWAEHAPGRGYRWLQRERGLQDMGRHHQYSLFRIGVGE